MIRCQSCSSLIELKRGLSITRSSVCPSCSAELHSCLNCRFHDSSMSNECQEPQAEWVAQKDRANFCDFFSPLEDAGEETAHAVSKESAREQLSKLFKK